MKQTLSRPHANSPTVTPRLQRKCGCAGACGDCEKKKELKRSPRSEATPERVPQIVHDVLRTSGEPLDRNTRSMMEPHFGHDFSQVRVHRDAQAARSADAVNARAFTVGSHIVLGETPTPSLLAHELTHTMQQRADAPTGELKIGPAHDHLEAEADAFATNVTRGGEGTVQRQEKPPIVAEAPAPAPAEERAPAPPAPAAPAAPATPNLKEHAGTTITDAEKKLMQPIADKTVGPSGAVSASTGARFVLHDTSAPIGAKRLKEVSGQDRGPLGGGIAAYVPRTGDPTIGRPKFFETYRPTATEFEKGLDYKSFVTAGDEKLSGEKRNEKRAEKRDAQFRKVYGLADPKVVDALFDTTLTGVGLTTDEIKSERAGNPKEKKDPFPDQLTGTGKVFTASAFTIEALCKKAVPDATGVAVKGKEKDLQSECTDLLEYFKLRNERVSTSTNVEIVQPGVDSALIDADAKRKKAAKKTPAKGEKGKGGKAKEEKAKEETKEEKAEREAFEARQKYKGGLQDTCNINNPYITPFNKDPYSTEQYDNIRGLYFRASLANGSYPKITTHYETDSGEGHCDPRCFNLTQLYQNIATSLAHVAGSTYGIDPKYGIGGGATVWWNDTFCNGKKPA